MLQVLAHGGARVKCPGCSSPLGCAIDCAWAPWNWDLPHTTRLGFLKRLGKWLLGNVRHENDFPIYVPWPCDLRWMNERRIRFS